MQSQSLQCPVCWSMYDLANRLPKIMPACGHSICHECLQSILKSQRRQCPLDKKSLSHSCIDEFPTNFALRGLIEENLNNEYCQSHPDEKIQFICQTDNLKLCAKCAVMNHNNHKVGLITEARAEQKKELEKKIQKIEKNFTEINEYLVRHEEVRLSMIEETFNSLFSILGKKKQEVKSGLKSCINEERKRISKKSNEIGKQAKTKMESVSFMDFKSLDRDISNYDIEKQAYLKEIKLQMDKEFNSFTKLMRAQIDKINEFDEFASSLTKFSKKMDSACPFLKKE